MIRRVTALSFYIDLEDGGHTFVYFCATMDIGSAKGTHIRQQKSTNAIALIIVLGS